LITHTYWEADNLPQRLLDATPRHEPGLWSIGVVIVVRL